MELFGMVGVARPKTGDPMVKCMRRRIERWCFLRATFTFLARFAKCVHGYKAVVPRMPDARTALRFAARKHPPGRGS